MEEGRERSFGTPGHTERCQGHTLCPAHAFPSSRHLQHNLSLSPTQGWLHSASRLKPPNGPHQYQALTPSPLQNTLLSPLAAFYLLLPLPRPHHAHWLLAPILPFLTLSRPRGAGVTFLKSPSSPLLSPRRCGASHQQHGRKCPCNRCVPGAWSGWVRPRRQQTSALEAGSGII